MIYLLQLYRLLDIEQQKMFISLFDDLNYEIDELGYKGSETDLISEMLENHLGVTFECDKQVRRLTDCILKNQGNLSNILRLSKYL